MSSHNPFGWDLPPGVTDKHINDAFGSPEPCPPCDGTGKLETISNCCGVHRDEDTQMCHYCKEPCEGDSCPDCDGTGTLTKPEPDYPDREKDTE